MKQKTTIYTAIISLMAIFAMVMYSCNHNSGNDHSGDMREDSYAYYTQKLNDVFGIDVLLPSESVEYCPGEEEHVVLQFSGNNNFDPISPLYHAGPILKLDEHCTIILPDPDFMSLYRSDRFPMYIDRTIDDTMSPFVSMMQYHLGLPWSSYYYKENNTGELYDNRVAIRNATKSNMIPDSDMEIKEANVASFLNNIKQWVKKQSNTPQTSSSNTDCIYLVNFLGYNFITSANSRYNDVFSSKNRVCYGVDFFRKDRSCFMGMFVVYEIQGDKSIDDYVEQISHYVRFYPDFKLE